LRTSFVTIALTVNDQFRRSIKSGDKHDSGKPVQISVPHKDAIAIEPPKKVCDCDGQILANHLYPCAFQSGVEADTRD
jgi:hypothetical protein